MKTLGIDVEAESKYRNKAVKAAEDMPCYPQEGYIKVKENYVVIKMSDTQIPSETKP